MTTLVTTAFTGTNGAAWPAPWTSAGGTATIQTNRGQQTTPTGAFTSTESGAGLTLPAGRVDAIVRIPAVPSVSPRINVRWNAGTGNGYRLIIPTDYAGFQLMKVTAYTETPLCEEFITAWAANTDYRVAVEFTGRIIRAKRWPAANPEPDLWQLSAADTTYTTGDVALVTVNGAGGGALSALWDDVTITDTPAGLPAARIGFHNDAFLGTFNDLGTYSTFTALDASATRAYTAAQTEPGLPMGGESAEVNSPHSLGPSAIAEAADLHFTFLNPIYHGDVLASWTSGEKDEMARRLGYRIRLTSATLPNTAAAGQPMSVTVGFANDGFARVRTGRPAHLVLVNGGTVVTRTLALDLNDVEPGGTHSVTESVTAPAAGSWSMHLRFPDPDAGLAATAAYAIQLANTGVWDGSTGRNSLGHTVVVS